MEYTYNDEMVQLVPQTVPAGKLLDKFFDLKLKRKPFKDGIRNMSVSELRDFYETMGEGSEWYSEDPDILVYHDDEKVYDILAFLYD